MLVEKQEEVERQIEVRRDATEFKTKIVTRRGRTRTVSHKY